MHDRIKVTESCEQDTQATVCERRVSREFYPISIQYGVPADKTGHIITKKGFDVASDLLRFSVPSTTMLEQVAKKRLQHP
jgi:hypothetical protein